MACRSCGPKRLSEHSCLRRGIQILVALILILPLAAGAHSEIRYISPEGDDSDPGTKERPWQSLQRASHGLDPGDTLTLLPRKYVGTLAISADSSAAAPLTVRAEPRCSAVVAPAHREDYAIHIGGASHVRIEGLIVRPDEYDPMNMRGTGCALSSPRT